MMNERIKKYVREVLAELNIDPETKFSVEFPADLAHGEYSTNVAMVIFGELARATNSHVGEIVLASVKTKNPPHPRALAEEIAAKLKAKNDPDIADISVAGPGFINFKLTDAYFVRELGRIIECAASGKDYSRHDRHAKNSILFEYTDPNPFKAFHVGHFLPATIGESFARLSEFSGAKTYRMTYGGDVGPHVAKTLWGLRRLRGKEGVLTITPATLGRAYVEGNRAYDEDEAAKASITEENKKLYDADYRSAVPEYAEGKKVSVEHFHHMYEALGIKFDHEVFESEVADAGMKHVRAALGRVFEESDGAIVYKGDETKGLHTRVFITKEGTPTYETKEVGLTELKFTLHPDLTYSVVITANEQNDYFKVLLAALVDLYPEYKGKLYHTGHGLLRFAAGKMSSRLGNVVSGAEFLEEMTKELAEKHNGENTVKRTDVAVAAIKFAILRQAIGKDIVFDAEQSISIEGDSGPYLQYTHARLCSLLEKGRAAGKMPGVEGTTLAVGALEKIIARFPEIVFRAQTEAAPHHVANYLIELAREFNAFYGNTMILDDKAEVPYKLALAAATKKVLGEGLWLLGIPAPERM